MGSLNRGRQRGYYFRFETNAEAMRFLQLYGDLLVPYSEATIYEKAKKNEIMKVTMMKGYILTLDNWNDEKLLTLSVLMMPESFNEIINSGAFDRVKARKSLYYYKLKAA